MTTNSLITSIGNTQLTRLDRISSRAGVNVFVKQERQNPAGSIKDRPAFAMVEDAIASGILKPNSDATAILEPTSGNTGIALAAIGASLGIPVVLTMPESFSVERRKLMSIYGAKLVLTPAANGMPGAIAEARRLADENPGKYFIPMQFENPANARSHFETTGPEIVRAIDRVDAFIAGVGTGGTVTGAGRFLKSQFEGVKIIALEPSTSPVITQTRAGQAIQPGKHGIQGIGAGFIPKVLDLSVLDDTVTVATEDAIAEAKALLKLDGISAGISGGANIAGILKLAAQGVFAKDANVVTVLPDGADKYLSTALAE